MANALPSLILHDAMVEARDAVDDAITAFLQSPVRQGRFPGYALMPPADLRWCINIVHEPHRTAHGG